MVAFSSGRRTPAETFALTRATIVPMAATERLSYCAVCDVVVTWRTWRDWNRHVNSAAHRECVIAPRPISPDRIRPIDPEGRHFGLAQGESGVFRRPDGSWVGIANLGAGASLRVEARQVGIAVERLSRQLPPDAPAPKRICLRCRLLLDPVAMSYHVSRKEHREQEDPWEQPPPAAPVAAPSPKAEPSTAGSPPDERFAVGMEPLLISVADAARVLGLSTSSIGSLAAKGTIPSLRIGKRVLLPVKALEEWIEGRLAEDADRYHAPWSSIRAYVAAAPARTKGRGYPGRRSW